MGISLECRQICTLFETKTCIFLDWCHDSKTFVSMIGLLQLHFNWTIQNKVHKVYVFSFQRRNWRWPQAKFDFVANRTFLLFDSIFVVASFTSRLLSSTIHSTWTKKLFQLFHINRFIDVSEPFSLNGFWIRFVKDSTWF